MKLPTVALAALATLALAGCGSPTGKTAPASTSPAVPPPSTGPSAAPSTPALRKMATGQPFEVPGWRITVTGQRCGPASDVVPDAAGMDWKDPTCVVATTAVNTGAAPAGFSYGYLGERAAYALDGQGRRFELGPYSNGNINPGIESKQPLIFAVPAGARLATVVIGDVAVALS